MEDTDNRASINNASKGDAESAKKRMSEGIVAFDDE